MLYGWMEQSSLCFICNQGAYQGNKAEEGE